MTKKDNYYIDNEEFREELIKLAETGEASERLHNLFFLLAQKIATKRNWRDYSFKEDMVVVAYMRCIKYAEKFDVNLYNPFSYFTTTIEREFLKYIKKEAKEQDRKWFSLRQYVEMMEHEQGIILEYSDNIKEKMYNTEK